MKNYLIWGAIASFLVGCTFEDINTPNGEIPTNYVQWVKPLEGVYPAMQYGDWFQKIQNNFHFEMHGNRPVLWSEFDVIKIGCESSIGDLQKFSAVIDEKTQTPRRVTATFHLNKGKCTGLLGKTVDIEYLKNIFGSESLKVKILRNITKELKSPVKTEHFLTWDLIFP